MATKTTLVLGYSVLVGGRVRPGKALTLGCATDLAGELHKRGAKDVRVVSRRALAKAA